MSYFGGVFLAFGLVLLGGCGGDVGVPELAARLRDSRQQPSVPIEVVPPAIVRPRFVYDPASLRDPFQPVAHVNATTRLPGRPGLRPNPQRPRQLLEGFAVDQFEMVGTLSGGGQVFALLRGAAVVHRLAVGDYLGPDHGQVTAIHDSHIELVELFPDGEDAWLERSRTLALNVHS
jgi:Tfp pilus assembly protein PilP